MVQGKSSSKKRAFLGIVGRFAKSLFGVSTEEDTRMLAKQIDKISKVTSQNDEEISAILDDFQSYVVKADKKFQLLEKATLLNNEAVNLTKTLLKQRITDEFEITKTINLLHVYGTQYVDTLADIRFHLSQTETAIQTLLNGYLPYHFVPPILLQNSLDTIADEVIKFGPFKLSHTEIGYYYHLQDITYKLDQQQLFIKIRIPLTATTTAFTLCRVHSVPIPLGANHSDKTFIEITKPYLAISFDNLFYMMLSESEYQFCTGNHFKRCNQALTMLESSSPDCALALFYDLPKIITELCQFTFVPKSHSNQTHIITDSENSYLISSEDTHWIQTCPNKAPLQMSTCKLCVIKLPCGCSLKGQTFFIPPVLQNCHHTKFPTINHTLNLAALFHFYKDNDHLHNLTSKSVFAKPVFPDLPDINIVSKEFNNVVKQEDKVKFSLSHIADNLKINKKMYSNDISRFSDDLGILSKPGMSTSVSIVTCLNFILVVIALAFTTSIYCRMMLLVRSASALNFVYASTTPTYSTPMLQVDNTYLFIFISFAVFVI